MSGAAMSETGSKAMTPSVGRIVHYYPPESHGKDDGGAGVRDRKRQPYPAIVTHVWSDTCVNLRVFDDGTFLLGHATSTPVVTSCTLAEPDAGVRHEFWSWPPRV
jgi:hypothetical protein